eukprot:CAMPEP_0113939118 /NCGR_PEP_ID=MMETSP1339-20121228/5502_1 /TAXON_ID=94617 /ORGANISM="Fibrocapsa japonica" /LENGTH=200 /DNA_ID=CAMNT_0000942541 /DNA_START=78 /DNA_END=681 /DNA_ORIENTATION=- /assembly_acc=CAM_ASM_000762
MPTVALSLFLVIAVTVFIAGHAFAVGQTPAASADSTALKGLTTKQLNKYYSKAEAVFETDSRPVILFDGVCNMCNGGVNLALDWDKVGKFRYAALQSETGKALLVKAGRAPDDISTIVLVEGPAGKQEGWRAYIKAEAVRRISAGLRAPLPLIAFAVRPVPRPVLDVAYDFIAANDTGFLEEKMYADFLTIDLRTDFYHE